MDDALDSPTDVGANQPTPVAPTPPEPAPAPAPQPVTPPITPPPAPAESVEDRLYRENAEQLAGARKALLASSLAGAVETKPEHQSKVVALADKLRLSSDVVEQNYDALVQRTQLSDIDYHHLLSHHPEVANWLVIPDNAKIAHDDVPVLTALSDMLKTASGTRSPTDPTGVLPYGYMFKKDGTIRGPIPAEGGEPIIYKNLDVVRAKLLREEAQQTVDEFGRNATADLLEKNHWFPNISAAGEASVAGTLRLLSSDQVTSFGFTGEQLKQGAADLLGGSETLSPGLAGVGARTVGQLLGDAPLYLLGGEIGGVVDLATSAKALAAAAKTLPTVSRSSYLADVFKNAAVFSPIAARSGVNTGTDQGVGYGVTDFLINAILPGAAGKFGVAKALIPGQETAAAGAGWLGVAGRLMAHTGAQGGAMAVTELANAIHEQVTGVEPDALKRENLLPRLAQAGAMGAVLSGAFHLPGEIGTQIYRDHLAARSALVAADTYAAAVELLQASKVNDRVPERAQAMLASIVGPEARTVYFQGEDWQGIAKEAGMSGDEFAAAMQVEEQWRQARDTGKTMTVSTTDLLQRLAAMGDAGNEKGVKAALMGLRTTPDGRNGEEAATFYSKTPVEIERQVAAMQKDIKKAARSVSEADPIYQDVLGKVYAAGRPKIEAQSIARLYAARFNVMAERWNTQAGERGTASIDAFAEYQRYALRFETARPDLAREPLDAMLDRLRAGDVPTERQVRGESLLEWARRRGIHDPGGDVAAMELDRERKPGTKALLREGGTPLDIAALRAHNEGFTEDEKPNTFLAALAQEGTGKPVYRANDDHPVHGATRDALLELEQHLASKGLSAGKQTNAEIKAALAGEELPAVKRFEQRLEVPSDYLRHEYLLKQWKKAHGDRSPTPTDRDWQKLVAQADRVDAAQGRTFRQGERGSIEFNAERHFLITLTGKADFSTVLHESAHFFLEVMGDFAEREGAPQEFKDDWAKILDYLGVEKRSDIDVEHHEVFARSIEQYLMEGHAPSPELRPVFQRFGLWLTDVYRKLKGLVTLTPEVRRVFDRMLASDDAIREAQTDLGGGSTLFPDRESSGMSERQWASYLAGIRSERERGHARVFAQAMKALRSEKTKTYKREYAAVRADAAAIVAQRPISRAEDALVHGLDVDGKDLPEKPKLDRQEIEDAPYGGKGSIHLLPRGITSTDKTAMSMRDAAERYGFATGEALHTALVNLPDRRAEIATLAEGMMSARHPDLTPEAMAETAMEAIHANDAHADVLNRETAALAMKAGQQALPREQIRRVADGLIAQTPHEDINPKLWLRAEKKAGRETREALLLAEPDYTRAFLAHQQQELAHACYQAALEAEATIEKTTDLFRSARRAKTRQMLGRAGGESWSVVAPDGSVMPYITQDAAAAAAKENGGEVRLGVGFQTAMDQMRAFWFDDPRAKEMPYGGVLDLYRQAQATMHRAQDAFTLLQDGKRIQLDHAVAEGIRVENSDGNGKDKGPPPAGSRSRGRFDWIGEGLSKLGAFMRKMSFVAREMDAEKDGGWHWEHFVKPLNHASDDEQIRQHANATEMDRLYTEYGKTHFTSHRVFVPEINDSLSLETRLAVALNSGSTKNLRRMIDGEGWTHAQIQAITNTLDAKDWTFVQGAWKHINSFWPEITNLHRRLDGIAPEKRDSLLISTPHGTIQGAYYPIIYDPRLSAKSADITMDKLRPGKNAAPWSGFTQKTAERTDMRLLLTLDGIHRHLNATAHWLSHAETIANMNKLLNDSRLRENMVARFGMESYHVIRDTVQDVAKGMQGPQNIAERIARFLRTRSGMATMGFNVMSALSQPFGLTQSMERVGAARYIRAQGRIFQSAPEMDSWTALVKAKSTMMRHRGDSLIVETAEQQGAGPVGSMHDWLQKHSYWMMNRMQWLVDLPTWVAAHEQATELFPGDDAKAIALADQAVLDTQGSGLTKDLSKAQRANEFTKMLMQFGGFFNSTYNLMYNRLAADAHLKGGWLPLPNDGEAMGRLAASVLLLVSLPTVSMSVFRQGMRPDSHDDGSVGWWAKRLAKDHLGYLLNTLFFGRELSGALDGFDYSGPAGMRSVALSSGLLKQLMQGSGEHRIAKSLVLTVGSLTGLPAVQAQRVIDAILTYTDHPMDPRPFLAGPPR